MSAKVLLSDFADQIVAQLPQEPCTCHSPRTPGIPSEPKAHFIFTAQTFPEIPLILTTRDLVMKRSEHHFGNCIRVDIIHFYATGRTYRQLAVLMLAALFAEAHRRVVIDLEHDDSEIRRLEIGHSRQGSVWGYIKRPFQFTYHPEIPDLKPWQPHGEYDRPEFDLEFREDTIGNPVTDLGRRDQAEIDGNDDALVLLAELLLNIGLPACDVPVDNDPFIDKTYKLESCLVRGEAGRWSAEAHFSLPKSFDWPGDYPDLG